MTLTDTFKRLPKPRRRDFIVGAFGTIAGAAVGIPIFDRLPGPLERAEADALPPEGVPTRIELSDAVARLVAAGALSPEKLEAVHAYRGGLPTWVRRAVAGDGGTLHFSARNAPYLLHLLWPLGLANRTSFNASTPLAQGDVDRFAATGGWTLGQAAKGGRYFNRVDAVRLDNLRERQVVRLADAMFRPCCNNSTLFQDCNHGSALLGLIQLGASQGLSDAELSRVALAAQAYWYPVQMTEVALYMNELGPRGFRRMDPAALLSARYFSASGWRANIHTPLATASLLPRTGGRRGGDGCSV